MPQDAFGNSTSGATATPTATPERRRPSEGLLLLVWAIVTVVAVVVVLTRAEHDNLNDPVQKAARGEITGVTGLSLLNPTQLTKALAKLRAKAPEGRLIDSARFDPTQVNVDVALPDYKAARYKVDNALHVSTEGDGETDEKGLAWSAIDPNVPAKILRKVNRMTGTKPTDVDYFALQVLSPAKDSRWIVFLARGTPPSKRSYLADLRGHHIQGNG
jgi:hypothetical protein